MSKLVVEAEWLASVIGMTEYACGMKSNKITFLTPAQERAGDEEEWVVVRKKDLYPFNWMCQCYEGDEMGDFDAGPHDCEKCESKDKCQQAFIDGLTTPQKEGEKDE